MPKNNELNISIFLQLRLLVNLKWQRLELTKKYLNIIITIIYVIYFKKINQ